MTKADELNALADRCEREKGGRKLDLAVAAAINGGGHFPYCLAYSVSLDAAVTLVPPDGWRETSGPRMYLNIPSPSPNHWRAVVTL